jgi:hypothetical protein
LIKIKKHKKLAWERRARGGKGEKGEKQTISRDVANFLVDDRRQVLDNFG